MLLLVIIHACVGRAFVVVREGLGSETTVRADWGVYHNSEDVGPLSEYSRENHSKKLHVCARAL